MRTMDCTCNARFFSSVVSGTAENIDNRFIRYIAPCYKILLRIKRLDFTSNEEFLRNVKQCQLIRLMQQRQLHFLGYILRKPEDEPANKCALFHFRHGKRKIGYPKLMFHRSITGAIREAHSPLPEEFRRTAQDKEWRTLVAD